MKNKEQELSILKHLAQGKAMADLVTAAVAWGRHQSSRSGTWSEENDRYKAWLIDAVEALDGLERSL